MIQLALGVVARRRGRLRPDTGLRAPVPVSAPSLTGSGRVGDPVTLRPGSWAGTPVPTLVCQWRRDGVAIPGAHDTTYLPTDADDRTALTCLVRAGNAAGSATAETAALPIVRPVPVANRSIPPSNYFLNSGVHVLNVSSFFQGSALKFSVTGEGVTIDPATGELSIATETLRTGITVVVTAVNSGGAAEQSFTLTIAAEPVASAVAPLLLTPPQLSGSGRIGEALAVTPGDWGGQPAPEVTLQWLRGGVEIPGATGAIYVPEAADDGQDVTCRVTASNAAGVLSAEPAAIRVTRAAPVVVDLLPDVTARRGAAAVTVGAAAVFAGEGLTFAVAGAGAAIDPVTGVLTIPTDAALSGETVTVTATNSGGSVDASFLVTIEVVPVLVAPVVLAAPVLAGSGKIGSAVTVDTGSWGGVPAPALSAQWLRDGAEIAGASGPGYVPGPEDDRCALSCRVTALNTAGSLSAETAALPVTYVGPERVGELFDEVFDQDTGPETVATAQVFAGEALGFAVTGAGAVIDPVTGVLTIATDAVLSGETVTVTASNSGGSAEAAFLVTVEAPPLEDGFPPMVPAEAWSVSEVRDAEPAGRRVVRIAADVDVPDGFELCLYSGPEDGLGNTNWRKAMLPGEIYTTNSSLKVGSTCHNVLFWRRIADGEWAQASTAIVFHIAGLETVPPEVRPKPTDGFPAADMVLGSASEALLRSTLEGLTSTAGWRTDSTGTPYYIIELPSGNYGQINWNNVRPGSPISASGATCNVYLRSQDRAGLGAKFNRTQIYGSQNIVFQFCYFFAQGGNFGVLFESCENSGLEYCHADCGSPKTFTPPKGYENKIRFLVQLDKTSGTSIRGQFNRVYMSLISGQARKGIFVNGNDDYLIAENVFEDMSTDSLGASWGTRGRVLKNWFAREIYPEYHGTEYGHMDGFQLESQNIVVEDMQVIGNVFMVGAGTAVKNIPHQGIFSSKTKGRNWNYENNIVVNNSIHGITQTGISGSDGVQEGHAVRYNTVLRCIDLGGNQYNTQYNMPGAAVRERNVHSSGQGNPFGAGSLRIDTTPEDRSKILNYYTNARLAASFYDLRPVAGAVTHWDHPNPVGAYQRFYDVIVGGDYPKIGPAAAAWKKWYDPRNQITS